MSKKLRTRLASALSAVIIPVTLVCSSVPALAAGTAGSPVADTAAVESSEIADKAAEALENSLMLPEITRERSAPSRTEPRRLKRPRRKKPQRLKIRLMRPLRQERLCAP